MPTDHPSQIGTADQVQLTKILLSLADQARNVRDAAGLESLSKIAALLPPYADESHVTLFFDLGEYLYECAQDIVQPSQAANNGWRDQAFARLQSSLRLAAE